MKENRVNIEFMGLNNEEIEKDFISSFNQKTKVEYVNLSNNEDLRYNYETDSGFDLRSNEESFTLNSLERKLVGTGIFVDVPYRSEIQIRPKSGLALKRGLSVLNTPGTVDEGYTGEIKVILVNLDSQPQTINKGDKIAQAVICPVAQGRDIELIKVDKIKDKDRNDNGFGSTGG